MAEKVKEQPIFQVLGGDHQSFINSYMKMREEYYIIKEHISCQMINVTPQDYNSMVEQLKGNQELIAKIPKAQTVFMIAGFFELKKRNKIQS